MTSTWPRQEQKAFGAIEGAVLRVLRGRAGSGRSGHFKARSRGPEVVEKADEVPDRLEQV